MPVDVVTEVEIARSLADVAAFAANPDNAPAWYEMFFVAANAAKQDIARIVKAVVRRSRDILGARGSESSATLLRMV